MPLMELMRNFGSVSVVEPNLVVRTSLTNTEPGEEADLGPKSQNLCGISTRY